MELLIKKTINNCHQYSSQSLAIICNSLADLGVKNDALFQTVKDQLLQSNEDHLYPIDCAQFMTAFTRTGFYDLELYFHLELIFKKQIDQVNSETLITMYCAH